MSKQKDQLKKLKEDLEYVELDQRLEMIKIPTLSTMACQAEANEVCGDASCNNDTCDGSCSKTS